MTHTGASHGGCDGASWQGAILISHACMLLKPRSASTQSAPCGGGSGELGRSKIVSAGAGQRDSATEQRAEHTSFTGILSAHLRHLR